jgi:multiple sugar transport system substrate-binding protein
MDARWRRAGVRGIRARAGKDLYTADGKLGVDADLTAAWLDYWNNMRKANGCVPPDVQALDKGSTDSAMLVLGKAAIDLRHSNFLEGFQLAHKEKLAITMYPQIKGRQVGPVHQAVEDDERRCHDERTRSWPFNWRISSSRILPGPKCSASSAAFPPRRRPQDALAGPERRRPRDGRLHRTAAATRCRRCRRRPDGAGEIQKLLNRQNQKVGFGQATPGAAAKEFVDESKRILGA